MGTLKILKMKGVNWVDQETHRELVQFIAGAPSLQKCDISWNRGFTTMYVGIDQGYVELIDQNCQVTE